MKERCRQILKGFTITLMTIQIILGMVYFFFAFFSVVSKGILVSRFQESLEYLAAAKSGMWDEYMAPLYPLILKIFTSLENLTGISYQIPLFFLQIMAGFVSIYFLLKAMNLGKSVYNRIFLTLFLMSMPLVSQWYVSVLPQAFAISACLMATAAVIEEKNNLSTYLKVFLGLVIAGLILEEMVWILAVAIMLYVFIKLVKKIRGTMGLNTRFFCIVLTITIISAAGAVIVDKVSCKPNSGGKVQKSLASVWVQKVVYPYYELNYTFFDNSVKLVMNKETAQTLSKRYDNFLYQGDDVFDNIVGREEAKRLYWSMIKTSFSFRTKENLENLALQTASCLFVPVRVMLDFQGKTSSLSGWNYSRMMETKQQFVVFYMWYGVAIEILFMVMTGINIFIRFLKNIFKSENLIGGESTNGNSPYQLRGWTLWSILIMVCVFYQILFQASLFDYKNIILISLFWGSLWAATDSVSAIE